MNDDLYERAAKNWDAVNAEIFRNLICNVYNIPYDALFGGTNMKIKYSRMIDAYVKKKYGDLDRGVLSDEVKYKVLFKIYRKKYKKEKALRKAIEKMHRLAPHPAEDTTLCDTCKYQNKDGEFCEQDLVQNKDKDCYEYRHYMIP